MIKELFKKIVKGIFIPMVVSMLFGFISAKVIYSLYDEEVRNRLSSSKIYLVQSGKYSSYDSMREENSGTNYIYYKDDEGYKTVVGITKDKNNLEKIKSLYDNDLSVSEYYISTEMVNDKQNEYDIMLNNTNDVYKVKEVVDNILSLYKEDDMIKLVLMD